MRLATAIFYLVFVVFPLATVAASAMEGRRRSRDGIESLPYTWGYFQGIIALLCGCVGLLLLVVPDGGPSELRGFRLLAGLLMLGTWGLPGLFVIRRRRWAWLVLTYASPNAFLWFINASYSAKRWDEFAEEAAMRALA